MNELMDAFIKEVFRTLQDNGFEPEAAHYGAFYTWAQDNGTNFSIAGKRYLTRIDITDPYLQHVSYQEHIVIHIPAHRRLINTKYQDIKIFAIPIADPDVLTKMVKFLSLLREGTRTP